MTSYFAYGDNMNPVHMGERCPGALSLGRATLHDHRFAIGAAGFGTVVMARGARVYGVLWRLDEQEMAALDEYEDVAGGMYRKDFVEVEPEGSAPLRAMIYRATDPAPGRAAPGYLERVVRLAEELGFPADYVVGLRSASAP